MKMWQAKKSNTVAKTLWPDNIIQAESWPQSS